MYGSRFYTGPAIRRARQPRSAQAGGPRRYRGGGQDYVYTGEANALVLGLTGSGKTRCGTLPMLRSFLCAGESFVALDGKEELYNGTACEAEARGYEVHVFNLREPFASERWEPLSTPAALWRQGAQERQAAQEMLEDLAAALYPPLLRDPFWSDSARSLFIGAAQALLLQAKPSEVKLISLCRLVSEGEERLGTESCLKAFVSRLPPDSPAAWQLQSYVLTASDTRGGIRSCFLEGLTRFVRSAGALSLLSGDDLRLHELDVQRPLAVYIVLPDESSIFRALACALCGQLIRHFLRLAQQKYGGRLPQRLNFVLEELAGVGCAIPGLLNLMAEGRSRNVRCQMVLQSLTQLETLYGAAGAETLTGNADLWVAFRTNQVETLRRLSFLCGERVAGECRAPLLPPSLLAALPTGQALVWLGGRVKFVSRLPDVDESFGPPERRPAPRPAREETRPDVFDVRTFVQSARDVDFALFARKDGFSLPRWDLPRTPASFDISRFEADLERKIAELEAAQRAEEAEQARPKYRLTLWAFSSGTRPRVVRALRDATGKTIPELRRATGDLPARFAFAEKEEADRACEAVREAGGWADVDEMDET